MRRNSLIVLFLLFCNIMFAQDSFEEFRAKMDNSFEKFKSSENSKFEAFRKKVNDEYAKMVKESWQQLEALKGLPAPKDDKPVPPTIFPEKDKDKPIKDETKPIVEVLPVIKPTPQPTPVVPIEEKQRPVTQYFTFNYFGSALKVRLGNNQRFSLDKCDEKSISKIWGVLSNGTYDALINDCLSIRNSHKYSDWAYLLMLKELSSSFFKSSNNEGTLLMAYIYCQSGYKMRLSTYNGRIYMLYASKHKIYETPYWTIDGDVFYPFDCKMSKLYICQASFPNEKPLSLYMTTQQQFGENPSKYRILQSKRYPAVKATVHTNQNLIDFYNTYPSSFINEDFGTRWAMYANTPIDGIVKATLYPALKNAINGLSQKESVERLLNWVQTAFVYEYDDKVWGNDRAFFAEETLFYPYCDCEDRSILLSRLVRDLLGLRVVLIYYPGHLATAVHFTENVHGDKVVVRGEHYVICDPTYIGAPVGLTMPKMDNQTAKVIMLEY